MKRVQQLDGLRGLAVLLVLSWHYYSYLAGQPVDLTGIERLLRGVVTLGWTGVDLFFVLSGFLIGGLLLDHRSSPNLFRVFYARRCCRIFPLYYLVVGVAIVGASIEFAPGSFWAGLFRHEVPLWAYAVYAQNFLMAWGGNFDFEFLNVSWSLAIEEQFYLILPPLVRWLPPRWLPRVALGLLAAAPLLRLAADQRLNDHAAYLLPFCRMDGLFLGVLLAMAQRSEAARRWLQKHVRIVQGVAWVTLACLVGLVVHRSPDVVLPWTYPGSYLLINLFWGSVVTLVAFELSPRLVRLFCARALVGAGTISYGIYLLHKPIFLVVAYLMHAVLQVPEMNPWLFFLLAAAATAAASWSSWRFYEKPLVAIGHRLHYDRRS